MTTPNHVEAFIDRVKPHFADFESIDLRVAAIKRESELVCLGARAVFMDCPSNKIPPAPDLVETDQLVLLQDRLPLAALPDLIGQIPQGFVWVNKRKIRFIPTDGQAINAGFRDGHRFYLSEPRRYQMGFLLNWAAASLSGIVSTEVYEHIDRTLVSAGAGYSDIVDLVEALLPGFQFERQQNARIEFHAPIRVTGNVALLEQSIDLRLSAGPRIDLTGLRVVALHKESQASRSVLRRTLVETSPKDWVKSDTGYSLRRAIRKDKEQFCELMVSYRGEKVYTAYDGVYGAPFPFPQANNADGEPEKLEVTPLKAGEKDEIVMISADFKGSTKLKEKFGTEAARPLLDDWENHFKSVAPIYRGLVLSWKGDGGLAYFRGDLKFENAYAAALHLLYYVVARSVRPILEGAPVGVRIAIHSGIIQGEADPGSIKSHDIDILCHIESDSTPRNSIVATGTYWKKCPERIRAHFMRNGEAEGESLYRTDFGLLVAALGSAEVATNSLQKPI